MKLKNVLTREQLERWASTLVGDINEDFAFDVFQQVYDSDESFVNFEWPDLGDDNDVVAAIADTLGELKCEKD